MKQRKPLDAFTKAKLLIQGEYLIIALIFLVCGILKLCDVMKSSDLRAHIFNFITLAGSIWIITDFIWSLVSPKRRAKVDMIDKSMNFPLGIYLFAYDLISIIVWNNVDQWYKYGISVAFLYVFISYSFQAVYHWFYPTKALIRAVTEDEEARKQEEQENTQDSKEEVKPEKIEEPKVEDKLEEPSKEENK